MISFLYSIYYSLYCNYFRYVPKNNHYEITKLDHKGTSVVLKKYIINVELPTLIVLPGTTGDTENLLFSTLIDTFLENNFNVLFILQQGQKINKTDPIPITSSKIVSINDLEDVEYAIDHIRETMNQSKLFILGSSFGALMMKKYLEKEKSSEHIISGISISSPWCLEKTFSNWNNSGYLVNLFYNKNFTRHYKNILNNHIEIFREKELQDPNVKIEYILKSESVKDMIDYQVSYYKFSSKKEFFKASRANIQNIKTPLMIIHTKDDPVCDIKNMPIDQIEYPHQVHMIEYGGHVGWMPHIDKKCIEWCKKFLYD
jgi:predicted alpha/beta-fold hydrolase